MVAAFLRHHEREQLTPEQTQLHGGKKMTKLGLLEPGFTTVRCTN